MIDDVVCVCVDRVDRFIPLRAWCSRMSAVFTQGSRRLAAIPAGKVPNMDGSEMIDLQRFNVQRSAFKLPRLLLRPAIKEQRLQTVIMTHASTTMGGRDL